ncbi:MAG: pyridoxal 5'-phosphate synthase glutaminase subunit PdxT [Planctomycetes bacterium]|nr:pyridoxal 5'-phosphate synthase glutaminase subunit PdxT [Planctomycetota bacterium]MCD7896282.1 pyridoxal 5'-phosphate synthase glutaminase subunit PdxT [Planctomycetaceae bacterium]
MRSRPIAIGVLALQGAFQEHIRVLERFPGVAPREIRRPADFRSDVAGLIIPGGESTVMAKLLADFALLAPLRQAVRNGLPAFGTCAGLILLAREIDGAPADRIATLDVTVKRNAYGRQLDSFATSGPFDDEDGFPMTFIRAPAVTRIGRGVRVLSMVDGVPVAVRQDNILATAFHPELTADDRVHRYFLGMVRGIPTRS